MGAGEIGQLGRRGTERRKIEGTLPERVLLGSRTRRAVSIGAGNNCSYAVDTDGRTWGWGQNDVGQSGTGLTAAGEHAVREPRPVIGLNKEELGGATVVKMTAGESHSLFMTSDGRVFTCGMGRFTGLPKDHSALTSDPTDAARAVVRPTQLPFPSDDAIVDIDCGSRNSVAITASGAMYTWGEGNSSELGLRETTEIQTPQILVRREGGSWAAVAASCGGQHVMALMRPKSS
jgi:regulator of chromosome condensation